MDALKVQLFDLLLQRSRLEKQSGRVKAQVDDLTQQESAVCGAGEERGLTLSELIDAICNTYKGSINPHSHHLLRAQQRALLFMAHNLHCVRRPVSQRGEKLRHLQ